MLWIIGCVLIASAAGFVLWAVYRKFFPKHRGVFILPNASESTSLRFAPTRFANVAARERFARAYLDAGGFVISSECPERKWINFLDELKLSGVVVVGESLLAEKLQHARSWTAEVADLATVGRKDGIRFTTTKATRKQIADIVLAYPFKPDEANAVIRNIVTPSKERYVVRDSVGYTILETNSRVAAWATWLVHKSEGATAHDRRGWIEDETSWLRCGDLPRHQRPD